MRFFSLIGLLTLNEVLSFASSYAEQRVYAMDINAENITRNLENWEVDLAIMAYVPWCKYCKQLGSSWDQIAKITEEDTNLAVVKLNCEGPKENEQVCSELGVDRYPSVYFVGYGDFNQGKDGKIIGQSPFKQIVRWTADLRPDAIYDWMRMLSSISLAQRSWDDFKSIFTGKSRAKKYAERLKQKVDKLERKQKLFATEIEKYKAYEIFDDLDDYGDPFPLLASLEPDEQNLPFRYCIGELAIEYCKYASIDEPFCANVATCESLKFEPSVCRPEKSPFKLPRGTKVLSSCLRPEVIEEYKTHLAGTAKKSVATATSKET